jgi:hypothetical protein
MLWSHPVRTIWLRSPRLTLPNSTIPAAQPTVDAGADLENDTVTLPPAMFFWPDFCSKGISIC